jgi:competence protein ComEC
MLNWSSIPFFRFTLAFIAGILFYIHSSLEINFVLLSIIAIALYVIFYIVALKPRRFIGFKSILGFTALTSLFFLGGSIASIKEENKHSDHIYNLKDNVKYYTAIVTSASEEKEKTLKTEVSIEKIKTSQGWTKAKGRVLLYLKKDNALKLNYGDRILIKGTPQLTKAPLNPYEFDYKNYLRFKQIYHTQFAQAQNVILIDHISINPIIKYSLQLRERCQHILREFITSDEEYQVASALILGIKLSLDRELINAYSSTGTMHVLAVSGLHVTIVFGMMMIFLNFLTSFKAGKFALPILMIFLLWVYALITGFSPSILRAVIMFSLMILAKALRKNTNIYNTLALSAFILLCVDPFFIMDAGFQLSYLAVLSIIYFQTKIYTLFTFKNYIIYKLWVCASISIAAQIITFPIMLYYFHQFPLNFIVSNLIAVPVSTLIVYSGMLLLILFWIPGVNEILGWITKILIWIMNQFLIFIEDLPYSSIHGIDLDLPEIIGLYLLIFFITLFVSLKKIQYLYFTFILVLSFSVFQISETLEQKKQVKFITFNIRGHKALAFINGKSAEVLTDSSLIHNKLKHSFHIEPCLTQYGIDKIKYSLISNYPSKVYMTDSLTIVHHLDRTILISPKSKLVLPTDFKPDYAFFDIENKEALEINL